MPRELLAAAAFTDAARGADSYEYLPDNPSMLIVETYTILIVANALAIAMACKAILHAMTLTATTRAYS